MVGELIKSVYKYTNVELTISGAKVNAHEVSVQNGRVVTIPNADVEIEGKNFNFSIYSYGSNGQKTYNLNSVPENIDGQAIVREFITFVEEDAQ